MLSAITIQFPPCTKGDKPSHGDFPTTLAGPPKQIAAPIPRVRVGVTNIRSVFVGDQVPKYHPADGAQHIGHGT